MRVLAFRHPLLKCLEENAAEVLDALVDAATGRKAFIHRRVPDGAVDAGSPLVNVRFHPLREGLFERLEALGLTVHPVLEEREHVLRHPTFARIGT